MAWLEVIRRLPFVKGARLRAVERDGVDTKLVIRTAEAKHCLLVEEKRTYLTIAMAAQAARWMRKADPEVRWLLAAPFIGPQVARQIADAGINYVDDVGNCRLELGPGYLAHIEGRRPAPRLAQDRGTRAQGYLVVLTVLARADLIDAPVRQIAAAAGVGKTTVAQMLAKLEADGAVGRRGKVRRIMDARRMRDLWLAAYEQQVRPHLLVGRYRAPEQTPQDVEARIEKRMPEKAAWGWGGGAACNRLTGFYRGQETVVHIADPAPNLHRQLGVLRARDGDIIVLAAPGTTMLEGALPRTAHPLLVHAELMTRGDARAREAAGVLEDKYLGAVR